MNYLGVISLFIFIPLLQSCRSSQQAEKTSLVQMLPASDAKAPLVDAKATCRSSGLLKSQTPDSDRQFTDYDCTLNVYEPTLFNPLQAESRLNSNGFVGMPWSGKVNCHYEINANGDLDHERVAFSGKAHESAKNSHSDDPYSYSAIITPIKNTGIALNRRDAGNTLADLCSIAKFKNIFFLEKQFSQVKNIGNYSFQCTTTAKKYPSDESYNEIGYRCVGMGSSEARSPTRECTLRYRKVITSNQPAMYFKTTSCIYHDAGKNTDGTNVKITEAVFLEAVKSFPVKLQSELEVIL